jgi:hypothetical protein
MAFFLSFKNFFYKWTLKGFVIMKPEAEPRK